MGWALVNIDRLFLDVFKAFTQARPEGWLVIALIIIPITAIALFQLWKIGRHLKSERRVLSKYKQSIPENANIDQAETAIENCLQSSPRDSLVTRAARSLWHSRGIPNPDLEAIATMLDQSEAARLSFARTAPNLLLLAGLLGTVLGLAGAIGTLGPQIQNTLQTTDPIHLTRDLGFTLQHMQTAFACTLWGILAAIIVAGFTRGVVAKQSNFLAEVEEFMIHDLVPYLIPKSQAAQLDDIRKVLTTGQRFLSQISEKMASASEQFEKVLTSAGDHMKVSLESLQTLTGNIQTTLTEASVNVQNSANALITSTETIKESTENLKEQHTDLRNAYTNLQNLFDESRKSLEEQITHQLEQIGKLRQDFGDSAQKIVNHIDKVSERLSESTQAFNKAGEKYLNSNTELRNDLSGRFKRLEESLGKLLADHQREMNRVEENLRLMNDRLQEGFQRLDPRLLPESDWQTFKDAVVQLNELLSRQLATAGAVSSKGSESSPSRPEQIEPLTKDGRIAAEMPRDEKREPPNTGQYRGGLPREPELKKPWWKFWSRE